MRGRTTGADGRIRCPLHTRSVRSRGDVREPVTGRHPPSPCGTNQQKGNTMAEFTLSPELLEALGYSEAQEEEEIAWLQILAGATLR